MPSGMNIPSRTALRKAFQVGVSSPPDGTQNHADARVGSRYDVWGGVNAVLSARIAGRCKDIFAQNYFSSASGDFLDLYMSRRFANQFPRVLATCGTGLAVLVRSGTATTTILDGTRISISIPNTDSQLWVVVDGSDLVGIDTLAVSVPIRASVKGASSAFSFSSEGEAQLKLEDPLDDPTWTVQSVTCGAGTDREKDVAYRARVLTTLTDARLGYESSIAAAMKAAGAASVQFFDSRWPYDDSAYAPIVGATQIDDGLNKIVVSDASGGSTPTLIRACQFALDSVACAGINAQAYGQVTVPISIAITITLWSQISTMNQAAIRLAIQARIGAYLQTHGMYWTSTRIGAAAQREARDAQSVAVAVVDKATGLQVNSDPDVTNLFSTGAVKLYTVSDNDIIVTFAAG